MRLTTGRTARSPVAVPTIRRAGAAAALAALPLAAAYRFALVYRVRAGYPKRHVPVWTPARLGLPFEETVVPTPDGSTRPAWFLPAGPDAGPGVVLVHGWESARDRTLPHAQFLVAAGFHVLTLDVRAHGANPPDPLPISVGEFAHDAAAAVRAMHARPEVTRVALLGHSMGAAGALVAAADQDGVDAVVSVSAPADPWRLTRQTFRLARLPIPDPIAYPLAWLTTRVYLQPRGHTVREISASRAVREIDAPVLLAHGTQDAVVPVGHVARLASIRRRARPEAVTEQLVVEGGHHSWLYEFPEFRGTVAGFLARALGGPLPPAEASARALAVPAERLPDPERLSALTAEPGGFRSLARVFRRVPQTRPGRSAGAAADDPPAAGADGVTAAGSAAADGATTAGSAAAAPIVVS